MSKPLFVFGSLRDSDIREIVLGRAAADIRVLSAWLPDYRALRLPDESYPVLVTAPGESVIGELLSGLLAEDFARIAFFENQEYRFENCSVVLEDGARRNALVCTEDQIEPGAREPWLLDVWQRSHKATFMEHTRQFMKLYGTVSPGEADEIWRELTMQAGQVR